MKKIYVYYIMPKSYRLRLRKNSRKHISWKTYRKKSLMKKQKYRKKSVVKKSRQKGDKNYNQWGGGLPPR
jgi:hypothetical protein